MGKIHLFVFKHIPNHIFQLLVDYQTRNPTENWTSYQARDVAFAMM